MTYPALLTTAPDITLLPSDDDTLRWRWSETIALRLDGWVPTVTWPGHE